MMNMICERLQKYEYLSGSDVTSQSITRRLVLRRSLHFSGHHWTAARPDHHQGSAAHQSRSRVCELANGSCVCDPDMIRILLSAIYFPFPLCSSWGIYTAREALSSAIILIHKHFCKFILRLSGHDRILLYTSKHNYHGIYDPHRVRCQHRSPRRGGGLP